MRRKTVKTIFLFFLIYLPVQYMLIGIAGLAGTEPWPAFALPGFKQVYSTSSETQVIDPQFYIKFEDSQTEKKVAPAELFQGLQPSQLYGFIRTNFMQPGEYSSEVKSWLKHRTKLLYPDKPIGMLYIRWNSIIFERRGGKLQETSAETMRVITIPMQEE